MEQVQNVTIDANLNSEQGVHKVLSGFDSTEEEGALNK